MSKGRFSALAKGFIKFVSLTHEDPKETEISLDVKNDVNLPVKDINKNFKTESPRSLQ